MTKTAPLRITLEGIPGIPEIRPGDDLPGVLVGAIRRAGFSLEPGDILVVAHKIVSKAEGRIVRLVDVVPSPRAEELAGRLGKDPAKVEVILSETREIVRAEWREGRPEGLLVVEHRLGFVMANAGVDESNAPPGCVLLLPEDPDASAGKIRSALVEAFGVSSRGVPPRDESLGVVITDSFGRPWRQGIVNVAIGVAGVEAMNDLRGTPDASGRTLTATVLAAADEIAAAAGLVMGKTEAIPAVLVRGAHLAQGNGHSSDLLRPHAEDAFRGVDCAARRNES